jgi:hypothetical protein
LDVSHEHSVALEHELQSWLEPFLTPLRHARQRMCPLYVAGFDRPRRAQKRAAHCASAGYDQPHPFVAVGQWNEAPLEAELLVSG